MEIDFNHSPKKHKKQTTLTNQEGVSVLLLRRKSYDALEANDGVILSYFSTYFCMLFCQSLMTFFFKCSCFQLLCHSLLLLLR